MGGFGRHWGDTRLLNERLFSAGENRDGDGVDIEVDTFDNFKSVLLKHEEPPLTHQLWLLTGILNRGKYSGQGAS